MFAQRTRRRVKNLIIYLLMLFIAFLFLLPLITVVSTSFKTRSDVYLYPPKIIPIPFSTEGLRYAIENSNFFLLLKNSAMIALARVGGVLFFNSLVAYAFAKLEWPGKNFWFYTLMAMMILPYHATLVPMFKIFSEIGLLGTFWPLILPRWTGSPFLIFLMRQFFMGIPNELSDAAKIDGASEFQIYSRIALPLAAPALATATIYEFNWAWNDLMGPLVYLNDTKMWTLPLGLNHLANETPVHWPATMATSLLTMIPTMIVFLLLQKYYVQTGLFGGMKG